MFDTTGIEDHPGNEDGMHICGAPILMATVALHKAYSLSKTSYYHVQRDTNTFTNTSDLVDA